MTDDGVEDGPIDWDLTIDDILNAPDVPVPPDYDDGREPAFPLTYDPAAA